MIDEGVLRVRQRAQLKGLAQYARTGLLVDQSVVHGTAAVDIGHMSAQIDRLMKRVAVRRGLVRHKYWNLRDGSARRQAQNGCGHAPDNASGRRQRMLFTQQPGNPSLDHHMKASLKKVARRDLRILAPNRNAAAPPPFSRRVAIPDSYLRNAAFMFEP